MQKCFLNLLRREMVHLTRLPVGLDISDLSVKIVQLDALCDSYRVRSFSESSLPPGCVSDGEITNADAVVAAIRRAWEKGYPKHPKTRRVVCSIPETKGFLRLLSMPKLSPTEMREAIVWELEENIPLPTEDAYFDFQIVKPLKSKEDSISDKENVSVLVVAVAKTVADSFLETLEKAGLDVIGMELESLAQARCLLPDDGESKTSLIVDIGDRRSSLSVAIGGTIAFTSSTHLSSQMITDAFSKQFNISPQKAERMKIEQGIGSPVDRDAFFRAAEPVLENLLQQIRHTIEFVASAPLYAKTIDTIILCGGGANTKGLSLYFSRSTGIPTEIGNPWTNISFGKSLPPLSRNDSVRYSTAIGLALQSMDIAYENFT
jgi:type IV pilus assembly protein PilM